MDESGVYKRDEGDRPVEHSPRGRYIRFDIKLGTGAYKTVYKAYDTDQGIDVAWNAIDIGVLPSAEKTRIIQEVQLLQKLEHKNIINFYGSWFSKEKNQVVFITEIMTSGTLKSYIKRVQFVKWKIIKRWCIQILEGLHYLHSQNPPVIHRDLKCDNIFINGNTGDLRIGDLGLSTQLAVHKKSRAQSVLGTPEFMAPELYDESYDEKVDIYAFGMCVLEMVTKEVPYSECINPAQIYKKVTAGIRPRGLQRIVSQAAKDFIELCLSRGNGLVDVSAEYLLDHPFLKAQDDDGEMVRCLEEDELEREMKQEQQRLAHVSEESFAEELNMESCSKGSDQTTLTDRRKTFPSLSLEPEELSSSSSSAATATGLPLGSTEARADVPSEEKSAGKHRMVELPPTVAAAVQQSSVAAPLPPLAPTTASTASVPAAATPALVLPSEPILAPEVDEPLSGKKDVDHNVNQFLATMPGSESKMQDNRMNLMGGRGQRLELERSDDTTAAAVDVEPSPTRLDDDVHDAPPQVEAPVARDIAAVAEPPAPVPLIPQPSFPPRTPSEQVVDYSHLRRPSLLAQSDHLMPLPVAPTTQEQPSRPPSASSSTSSSTTAAPRKRGRRHEIRAEKDPENEHSIVLYLRLTIDGKSKEIKFPFNLFSDSTHDVACELALDVGILEPDLEDIADSISFLVTEGKINNLPHVSEDVWDEAPEPHSFSSKPLPHVSKMSFVAKPGPGVPTMQLQQVPSHLLSPAPGAVDWSPNAPAYSLGEPALASDASSQQQLQQQLGTSGVLTQPTPSLTSVSAAPAVVTAPGLVPLVSDVTLAAPVFHPDSSAASVSSSAPTVASIDVPRSPHVTSQLVHAASEISLTDDHLFPKQPEGWERGISVGSVNDPTFMRKVHGMEDRLKIARSAFDERDSNLVAAMREAEEKHLREVERFRRQMEELSKQRAAIAHSDRMSGQPEDDLPAEVDLAQVGFDESLPLGYNGVLNGSGAVASDNGYDPHHHHALHPHLHHHPVALDSNGFPAGPMIARSISFDSRRVEAPSAPPSHAASSLPTSVSHSPALGLGALPVDPTATPPVDAGGGGTSA